MTDSRMTDEQIKQATIAHFVKQGVAGETADDWSESSIYMMWFRDMGLPYARAILAAAGERVHEPPEPAKRYAERHNMAVTRDWMVGWDACRNAWRYEAAAGERVDAPAEPLLGFSREDLGTVAESLEDGYEKTVDVAVAKLESTTAYAARFIRAALAASPADAPQPANAAEPDYRKCEFCGCNTNAKVRACCKRGYTDDRDASDGASPAKAACPAPVEPTNLRKALERIAERGPTPTQSQSGRPRLRCWHCRNAWMVGHEPERHSDNCAWIIAREALAASPSSAASASPATQPLPAETAQPMFASHVGRRKWEQLQGDGFRMQRIEFARSIDGHERRGSIDPWGKVLWQTDAASPAVVQASEPVQAFERAMKQTWQMVDPIRPPPAGTYAMGEHNGICAALKTLRENFTRELAAVLPDGEPPKGGA